MNNLRNIVYINTSQFDCANGYDPCGMKERTLSFALFANIPETEEPPEAIFKECCYTHYVLASSTDAKPYKNDFVGFYHKRQLLNEVCDFVLIKMSDGTEYDLDSSSPYGTFNDFGDYNQQKDLKTFVLNWRDVLLDLGVGSYKVIKRFTIAGVSAEKEYLVYNLKEYSSRIADKTARIDVTMSGLLEKSNVDFTGTDFKTSIRVGGFFGRREVKFEEDVLIDRAYNVNQITMKQTNEYKFQTNMVPDCITNEIYDFILFSDDIRVNDYNLNNHSYDFKNFPVKLANNEGTGYYVKSRKAMLNLVFSDKVVDNNKRNY